MSVVDTIIGKANQVVTVVKPHLPTIGIIGGGIAVCAGGFITGRATLKVDQILNDHKDMIDSTRRENNGYSEEQYSEIERKKDVLQIYGVTARRFTRLYAPGVGLCVVGFACMFKGLGTLKKWHALAVSAAASLSEQFSNYRGNVVNELGVEADKKFLLGDNYPNEPEKKVVKLSSVDENGETTTTEKEVYTIENIIEDDFTRVFNYKNPKWDNGGYVMNDSFITNLQQWYTKQLQSGRIDHVFLNSLFTDFGYDETGIGHFYGWTNKPGCNLGIEVTPYIEMWDSDDDKQFPMYIPYATATDENGRWFFINEEDEEDFKRMYIEDDRKVGFILKFLVDTDENGIPKNIYDDVYNKHLVKVS